MSLRTDEYDTHSEKVVWLVQSASNLTTVGVLNVKVLDYLKELGLGNLSIFYRYR